MSRASDGRREIRNKRRQMWHKMGADSDEGAVEGWQKKIPDWTCPRLGLTSGEEVGRHSLENEYIGFVYCNSIMGVHYVGRCTMYPGWEYYCGSNKRIRDYAIKFPEQTRRVVLDFAQGFDELRYMELAYQFAWGVLLDSRFVNGSIQHEKILVRDPLKRLKDWQPQPKPI